MPTKPSHKITLRDKLSRLSYRQACLLLGDEKSGSRLLIEGGRWDVTLDQVRFTNNLLRVEFPGAEVCHWVEIRLSEGRKRKLDIECDVDGEEALLFKAAVLALVLEEKRCSDWPRCRTTRSRWNYWMRRIWLHGPSGIVRTGLRRKEWIFVPRIHPLPGRITR